MTHVRKGSSLIGKLRYKTFFCKLLGPELQAPPCSAMLTRGGVWAGKLQREISCVQPFASNRSVRTELRGLFPCTQVRRGLSGEYVLWGPSWKENPGTAREGMIFQGHADTHKGKVCFKEKYRAASIVTERGESVPPNRGNHEFTLYLY